MKIKKKIRLINDMASLSLFFLQKAFQGTVVTIENFLAWKARFEQEMAELKRKKQKEDEQAGKNKLTGKCKEYNAVCGAVPMVHFFYLFYFK